MTLDETTEILVLLHVDSGKMPSKGKIAVWASDLEHVPYALGVAAAKRMRRLEKIYGEPQWQDYRKHVNTLYKAARARARGFTLDSAARSRMSPRDAEAYDQLALDIRELDKYPRLLQWAERTLKGLPPTKRQKVREINRVRKTLNCNQEAHHIVQRALEKPVPRDANLEDDEITGNEDGRYIRRSDVF